MIRILESIDTNNYSSEVKNIIDILTNELNPSCKVVYVDESLMPDEITVEFVWEYDIGNEEYIGSWEVIMNKEQISNYNDYLKSISEEIKTAYSFIEEELNKNN